MVLQNLAEENLTLFLHCFSKGHETLQMISLQIITDILATHPSLLMPKESSESDTTVTDHPLLKPIQKSFLRSLKSQSPSVAAAGTTALSKLMLPNVLNDPEMLKALVLAYFSPETQTNPAQRQALTYFLPVYCHSRRANAERMARVAVSVMHTLLNVKEELEEDEEGAERVGLSVIANQSVDWTDGRKIVGADEKKDEDGPEPHLALAETLLDRVATAGCNREEKKLFLSTLTKLHITPSVALMRDVLDLATEALDSKVAVDATSRNALTKLHNNLSKIMANLGEDTNVANSSTAGASAEQTTVNASVAEEADENADTQAGADETVAGVEDTTAVTIKQEKSTVSKKGKQRSSSVEGEEDEDAIDLDEPMPEPDAEGTVWGLDPGEEEDDDEGTMMADEQLRSEANASLVESLLEDGEE